MGRIKEGASSCFILWYRFLVILSFWYKDECRGYKRGSIWAKIAWQNLWTAPLKFPWWVPPWLLVLRLPVAVWLWVVSIFGAFQCYHSLKSAWTFFLLQQASLLCQLFFSGLIQIRHWMGNQRWATWLDKSNKMAQIFWQLYCSCG